MADLHPRQRSNERQPISAQNESKQTGSDQSEAGRAFNTIIIHLLKQDYKKYNWHSNKNTDAWFTGLQVIW